MPQHKQEIPLTDNNTEAALITAMQAMKNLNWPVLFAGTNALVGNTPKSWNNAGQQIAITAENNTLTVASEMVNNEAFDFTGRNKKNVNAFLLAYEAAKNNTNTADWEANKETINTLRATTEQAVAAEQQEAAEVAAAMNLAGSNLYVTYGIIGINVLVFILMAVNGAGIFEANGLVHIKWGSDYAPLTLSGDWWRIITSIFLHFGIIHLLMNMYSLYSIAIYLEPMLGKLKYTAAYLCTGVFGSIASLWWHTEPVNSAGASGAIFGMYGLFLALLTTKLIPQKVRQGLLQSIGIFVVYNLIYGVKGGVDNAAHIGGLLSGFLIGYIYVFGVKKEKAQQNVNWLVPAVVIITAASAFAYLQQNKTDVAARKAILNQVEAAGYKDDELFNNKIEAFAKNEEKALAIAGSTDSLSRSEFAQQLKEALPLWDAAAKELSVTAGYNISPTSHKRAAKLIEYVQLRKQELELLISLNNLPADDDVLKLQLEETGKKINAKVEELKNL